MMINVKDFFLTPVRFPVTLFKSSIVYWYRILKNFDEESFAFSKKLSFQTDCLLFDVLHSLSIKLTWNIKVLEKNRVKEYFI